MALDALAGVPRQVPATARPAVARLAPAVDPNATLMERHDLAPTMMRLRILADDDPPPFRAGQYVAIGLAIEGKFIQRPYSVASPPGDPGPLEFLVRLVPGGSLTPRLWQLRPGDRVRLGPPKGLFVLDEADPRQHLLLATGTGLAPLRSMLTVLLPHPGSGRAAIPSDRLPVVVHGVATAPELAYREQLEHLSRDGAIVYVPSISRPTDPVNAAWRGPTGRLDELINRVATQVGVVPASCVAFLCGNPAMVKAVGSRLAGLGLPADAIRAEEYWTSRPTTV